MVERQDIQKLVVQKRHKDVLAILPKLLQNQPSFQDYTFAVEVYDSINAHIPSLMPVRIAILRSFTLEPMLPVLKARLYEAGFSPDIYLAGYNQVQQEILNPDSQMFSFGPDVIVLAARLQELQPLLAHSFLELKPEAVSQAIEEVLSTIRMLLEAVRQKTDASVILHNFEMPLYPSLGILDSQHPSGQIRTIRNLNENLARLCQEFESVYLLDYDYLQSIEGRLRWNDSRMWYLARMPISRQGLISLAQLYVRYIQAVKVPRRKCMVLDADNTLWGGIIGEDGIEGIQLGPDYPGSAFVDFQRLILNLYNRGVILALNSKNNLEDVLEVLNNHPHMILGPEHFAAICVNWDSKPQNMKAIAANLNIGIDSLVFLDDSQFECEMMRQEMPEVLTVQLGQEPAEYLNIINQLTCFDVTTYTSEDRNRGRQYRARSQTQQLKTNSSSLEDFYRSLKMCLVIGHANEATIGRIAQMTQKINQFNLTARRYSESQIARLAQSDDTEVFWMCLEDRFCDNGIVAVLIIRKETQTWTIDTFLMSCRVIGRTLEQAILSFLYQKAHDAGSVTSIIGEYISTDKNSLVQNLYENSGFRKIQSDGEHTWWQACLSDLCIDYPEWFEVRVDLEKECERKSY